MKLGNGVGTVYKLSGKRRNPYIVRKTVGWEIDVETGKCKQVCVTIGYAPTRAKGLEMLMEYNKIHMTLRYQRSLFLRCSTNGHLRNFRRSRNRM